MAADQQTSLRFSLKESVWFQKGQEVNELLSISLDPDVAIEEREYEIVVCGQLDLTGEYIPKEETEAFSLRELSPVRTIDYVETRDDGINELVHSFPLEISIPRGRVKQVEDLYVDIEEFDYVLLENGCLQLLADISIHGLCDEEREVEETVEEEIVEEEIVEKEVIETDEWEDYAFEPFQLEARQEPELELEEEKEIEEEEQRQEEEQGQEEVVAPQLFFGRKETKGQDVDEKEEISYSQRDENALYLTKLFSKQPEDEFTKLRLYFVQEGDTIESVAERYDTSVQHLHRVNQTDDLYLTAGQILYIPVPKMKAK
ncbi:MULTISPECIES: stage VI sporulation protein D [unclassified Bacillus (in: firmicutes)]|uniref:stage VI sporulation protein D n=1 Tax=unclassified Bacillus (in: firmicutes) TaxID=185979 RepID=UPI0008EACEA2|nr:MULTISPECIES: stage VI sporulation protein D [unclassified Bacillus (in: firmicutes)]SFJ82767.1 stage VI sporulation protein D [Bacillus sp. 71mf]SFS53262.1 stage VI sporulation protein D [Bacillus sp. 103mf]